MSEYKYLDKDGLIYYHSKIKNLLSGKVDKENGKGLSTNDYTTTEKNKLNGIASGAEVNQNAFSNIAVGSTTIAADSKTDTLTIVAGNNITLTPNATSDTLTIAADAEPIIIDSEIDSTSENPVQNKVIATALDTKIGRNDYAEYGNTTMGRKAVAGTIKVHNEYGISIMDSGPNAGSLVALNASASEIWAYSPSPNHFASLQAVQLGITSHIDTSLSSSSDDTHYPSSKCVYDAINDSGFITNTDYATTTTGGVIKLGSNASIHNGVIIALAGTADTLWNRTAPNYFASFDNVYYAITSHIDTSLSSSSDDTHYPSSKCVYDAINDAIGSVTGISYEIVQTLPQTGSTGVIYLISNNGTAPNVYDEYIWLASSSSFEKIGTTAVDLSGYVQASEMVTITNAEIDTIVA
jgi:hypothetical protein